MIKETKKEFCSIYCAVVMDPNGACWSSYTKMPLSPPKIHKPPYTYLTITLIQEQHISDYIVWGYRQGHDHSSHFSCCDF